MTTTTYSLLLAFTLLSVALLVWRGITRLDKKGETEPPRPVVSYMGAVLGGLGVALALLAIVGRFVPAIGAYVTRPYPLANPQGMATVNVSIISTSQLLAAVVELVVSTAVIVLLCKFFGRLVGRLVGFFVVALLLAVPVLLFGPELAVRSGIHAAIVAVGVGVYLLVSEQVRFSRLFLLLLGIELLFPLSAMIGVALPVAYYGMSGGIAVAGAGLFVLGRRPMRKGFYRAVTWWTGALLGIFFATAAPFAIPEETTKRVGPVDSGRDVLGFCTLGAGVIFLWFVLAGLLPLILDALEGRSFESFVGARHVRATKSGFLTVISVLSIAGVAVSSCALCSVTSIMGGFGADLKRKILNNNAHILVDINRPGGFSEWHEKLATIRAAVEPHGGKATPVVGGDAMGSSVSNTAGALVRGIDPETIADVIDLDKNIEVGQFEYLTAPEKLTELPPDTVIGRGPGGEPYFKGPDFKGASDADPQLKEFFKKPNVKVLPAVIIGKELAKSLHVLVGDELSLLSPMGELGPTGVIPRTRRFRVAAIFYSGMYEYDATHAYILLGEAQKLFSLKDESTHTDKITNIDIRVPDAEKVKEMRPYVDQVVAGMSGGTVAGAEYRTRDWMEMNKNLFSALKLEKLATFIILSIAIAVASFCIVCTLLLMVTEKGKEIAILKALGATDGAIMRTFMIEGIVLGGIGTVYGVGTALFACTGLAWFGKDLPEEVYYINRLPVNVNLADYGLVAVAALVICTLATIYPAKTASDLSPLEGLRWE